MDKIDLEELERLHKEATPGPWKVGEGHSAKFVMTYEDIPVRRLVSVIDGDKGTCDLARGWDESCANAAYIVAACNAAPELVERVRELERERELYRERLHESWNQTEYCIDLLHDAGVNLTMWACGVESCQQCDVPECDMGDLDMVEKYASRKAIEQAARDSH